MFPPTVQEGSLFSTSSPTFIVCRFLDDGYSDWCEVILPYSFDLLFFNKGRCWASFYVFINYLHVFFGEMSALGLLPTFWLDCLFFWYWAVWVACILWTLILCQLLNLLLFSSIWRAVFHRVYSFLHCEKLLSLVRSHLFLLFIFQLVWEVGHRESCGYLCQRMFCLCFPLRVL